MDANTVTYVVFCNIPFGRVERYSLIRIHDLFIT